MTRRDYILIAEALRVSRSMAEKWIECNHTEYRNGNLHGIDSTINLIAMRLSEDNPRFDRDHFLAVVRGEKELNSRPTRKVGA